ncbi:hypothetical protein L284_06450 [Novosphingobium lindaniclasticum LE124]|uniref:Uncharacterized protein n=1 Tax=Novosphingobium lindaniclasticum LE124 TaxID=1096930 RepID=T0J145_9SPHN|nr:hypothetical protein L284_06450 [Novosphingobium lindaniclasticum LE124]
MKAKSLSFVRMQLEKLVMERLFTEIMLTLIIRPT